MQIQTVLALTYDGVLLGTCLFAAVRGGRPERIGALINLLGSAVSSAVRITGIGSWAPAEIAIMMIDLGVAAAFFWLAVTTTRFWPIWAFGFALADIFTSWAGGLLPGILPSAYATGLGLYAYLALAALTAGTWALPRHASPSQWRGGRDHAIPSVSRQSTSR